MLSGFAYMVSFHAVVWSVAGSAIFTYGYLQRKKGIGHDPTKEGWDARVDAARRSEQRSQGVFSMAVGALFVLVALVS